MPNRILREGILTSDRMDKLDAPSEVFYRRLMSKVDDFGLHDARPSIIRSFLFPLRSDRVREADITRWIAACEKAGVIALYTREGKPYLQMLDTEWQTRSEPKCPLPPWGKGKPMRATDIKCTQAHPIVPVFVDVVVDVVDTPLPPVGDGGFARFWAAYPATTRKAAKAQCLRKWGDMGCALIADRIVEHLEAMKRNDQWTKDNGQFIPAPIVYLNQARWEAPTSDEESKPWHQTRSGIESKGEKVGLGRWDQSAWERGEREAWPQYQARVFAAANHSPRAAA